MYRTLAPFNINTNILKLKSLYHCWNIKKNIDFVCWFHRTEFLGLIAWNIIKNSRFCVFFLSRSGEFFWSYGL